MLFNFDGEKVYEGSGRGTTVFNISSGKLYEGSGRGKVLLNWDGDRLSEVELAATIWLTQHPY